MFGTKDMPACVDFLQRLIRIPSLPGEEGAVARLVQDEMQMLGYDEVSIDTAGNVVGVIHGRGAAPPMMFNTHLDHVAVGHAVNWPSPPYGGHIRDDAVWGRGAVDIKGPLAAQVYGLSPLVEARPPGDIYVTSVVQEEIGGVGARYMASRVDAPVVIIGEPSGNTLRRGHRGRLELVVRFQGKSVHASIPQHGRNPLGPAAVFIGALDTLAMRDDPVLGASSLAPTRIWSDQPTTNVIPAEVTLMCDWRSVPAESADEICARLQELADRCCTEGMRAHVSVAEIDVKTYTGYSATFPAHHPAFLTDAAHPAVVAAERALTDAIGLRERAGIYRFATDGGLFSPHVAAVMGFGPGNGELAHTTDERIDRAALEMGMTAYHALGLMTLAD